MLCWPQAVDVNLGCVLPLLMNVWLMDTMFQVSLHAAVNA